MGGLLGAALAPTDPAVMFSVLGDREIGGRTGTILLGESGANDPVGIALMLGMIELATHADATFWIVVREFAAADDVGLAVGVAGGLALGAVMRRLSLPTQGSTRCGRSPAPGSIYGARRGRARLRLPRRRSSPACSSATSARRSRPRREIFNDALSSLAEIVVFVALGLTISITALGAEQWVEGLVLAAVLALVIRPLVVGPLLLPVRLRRGEKAFIVWGGLKGAVPILLASLALERGVHDAAKIYEIVFVVVLASVVVQGSTVPLAARRLGVRMKRISVTPPAEPSR